MKTLVRFLVLLAIPMSAFAISVAQDAINSVPEPETFSLIAIGAVAMLATTLRKRK